MNKKLETFSDINNSVGSLLNDFMANPDVQQQINTVMSNPDVQQQLNTVMSNPDIQQQINNPLFQSVLNDIITTINNNEVLLSNIKNYILSNQQLIASQLVNLYNCLSKFMNTVNLPIPPSNSSNDSTQISQYAPILQNQLEIAAQQFQNPEMINNILQSITLIQIYLSNLIINPDINTIQNNNINTFHNFQYCLQSFVNNISTPSNPISDILSNAPSTPISNILSNYQSDTPSNSLSNILSNTPSNSISNMISNYISNLQSKSPSNSISTSSKPTPQINSSSNNKVTNSFITSPLLFVILMAIILFIIYIKYKKNI